MKTIRHRTKYNISNKRKSTHLIMNKNNMLRMLNGAFSEYLEKLVRKDKAKTELSQKRQGVEEQLGRLRTEILDSES